MKKARFKILGKDNKSVYGVYDGVGFAYGFNCPEEKSCKYYAFIEGSAGMKYICTHPNSRKKLEFGGLHKCPK